MREISTNQREVLETVVTEPLLAHGVVPAPVSLEMVCSVVLTHQTCHRIEQVRVAQKIAAQVEHGLVCTPA